MDNAKINEKRRQKYVGPIDLDDIQRQFLGVLKREALQLLEESYGKKLSEESSKALVNYIKLLKQVHEQQLEKQMMLSEDDVSLRAEINTKKENE